ncbi:acetoin utilization protein AcuC [Paraoerskovia sediminicola]|uniref:Acetoin utilization protein AcuC n=1 Tax=Paraoerskovia sediminicola TaxID=1138587 RepID=A0ABM8G0A8_9CELL|nr:acetoin utilization protein AcuC [Paraoerskovia sediminicola]BDZ41311.1 acetoin utilization protein AcuC [Paraoerskovia sediminicola]
MPESPEPPVSSLPPGSPDQLRVMWTPDFLGYDFGLGHPMTPTRLDLTVRLVRELGILDAPGLRVVAPVTASDDSLRRVHDADYVAAVHDVAAGGPSREDLGLGTQDDPVFPGMDVAAARIFGASTDAASAVWSGAAVHACNFAGGMHHAMPSAAAGFCVYNDAAGAVRQLLDEGAERVAYVDLDAHHGDGVEAIFWDDPRVLTYSVHQNPLTLFPGTGFPTDTGGAPGTVVNVCLPPRTEGAGWLRAIDATLPEALRSFDPQVIVSQHGCDSHRADPLSDLRTTLPALRTANRWVHELAHELCEGRWVSLGGGGYAVCRVVPFAWMHLLAEAAHVPVSDGTVVPEGWRAYVDEISGERTADVVDAIEVPFARWSAGYDPGSDLDRSIQATRNAVFPGLGLDPQH